MRTKLKICGVRTAKIAKFCDKIGVDFIGLNMVPQSPRYIDPKEAKKLRKLIKKAKVVGVFANANTKHINQIAKELNLDYVQLHGREEPQDCEQIEFPTINAIPIATKRDLQNLETYKKYVQYFLFDRKDKKLKGGSGKTFNWAILKNFKSPKPYFLAGGLNTDNIESAMKTLKPFAVDIASGSEEGGVQTAEKIQEIFDKVHAK